MMVEDKEQLIERLRRFRKITIIKQIRRTKINNRKHKKKVNQWFLYQNL